jgi:hypothetical protein
MPLLKMNVLKLHLKQNADFAQQLLLGPKSNSLPLGKLFDLKEADNSIAALKMSTGHSKAAEYQQTRMDSRN